MRYINKITIIKSIIIFLILSFSHLYVLGQGLSLVIPEEVGLSSTRLARIDTVLNSYVRNDEMPGMVTMIARNGKVAYFKAFGMMNIESKKEMTKDAIFRIASMSKVITSVAVMILYEEGRLLLTDPISKYIPEFSNPKVITQSQISDSIILIPAKSEITIRQLLNHTSGITYGKGLQQEYYKKAGMNVGVDPVDGTISEMVKKLGNLPLICHPGEEFNYGLSIDVLGYLIEVISGIPLDEFLKKRIFEPLKMSDTYFSLPKDKFSRLPVLYKSDGNGKLFKSSRSFDQPVLQTYFAGGAGLLSTTEDYFKFVQMLLNGGEFDGKRIISRKTVELMTSNSVGNKYLQDNLRYNSGDKFGYGLGIRTERGVFDGLESIGSFGWDGALYTRFWIDPKENLIGIFMSQADGFWSKDYVGKFKVLVYQSIVD